MRNIVIEIKVRNHPGVMSHISGLFARRAYNLEGILCGPIGDGSTSVMYLLVSQDRLLDQVIKNIEKLYDVLELALRHDYDDSVFYRLGELGVNGRECSGAIPLGRS